jgi:hypothetical protein
VSAPLPIVGVSLGLPTGERFTARVRQALEAREAVSVEYRVRHLERQPSRYSAVAQRIPEIVHEIGRDVLLVVDVGATGRPVYSLIMGELISSLSGAGTGIRFKHCPVSVTGIAGGVSRSPDVGLLVPRRDLISASQILFDAGQLKIAEGLDLAGTLRDELLAFRPKATKPDDLEGWREGKDDDLVLAVATGVWAEERFLKRHDSVPAGSLGAA